MHRNHNGSQAPLHRLGVPGSDQSSSEADSGQGTSQADPNDWNATLARYEQDGLDRAARIFVPPPGSSNVRESRLGLAQREFVGHTRGFVQGYQEGSSQSGSLGGHALHAWQRGFTRVTRAAVVTTYGQGGYPTNQPAYTPAPVIDPRTSIAATSSSSSGGYTSSGYGASTAATSVVNDNPPLQAGNQLPHQFQANPPIPQQVNQQIPQQVNQQVPPQTNQQGLPQRQYDEFSYRCNHCMKSFRNYNSYYTHLETCQVRRWSA